MPIMTITVGGFGKNYLKNFTLYISKANRVDKIYAGKWIKTRRRIPRLCAYYRDWVAGDIIIQSSSNA